MSDVETRAGGRSEPIAVIGMACRFPGGIDSPEAFWRLLAEGRETVGEVPAERWNVDDYYDPDPGQPGKMVTRHGNFLDRIDGFDAAFFGIAPREAARMDPQQRLLLELAWEALERAGLPASRVSGTETGVFAGISGTDYWWLQLADLRQFDGHAGMGGAHCIATGRVSYLLNLRGPNMALDTACSSSLVAVHLATQSLRSGECDLALAGGVNAILSPTGTVFLSKWGALSPDGRCKPFDASADGFGRGEGCGMVVLKRLSDARRDGDTVLAVVRGSATNQDGHSTRLSAPNGPAQQAVIRKALANAGVKPEEISFVEAHGTGTPLGDPIEVGALVAELAPGAPGACAIGSAKANIGHLESAAGIAGLIKTVLCLQHGAIPGQIHFDAMNPDIHLDGTRFRIPTRMEAWEPHAGSRLAGVSSFGLSGTNAHVILEEARTAPAPRSPVANDRAWLVPLSARSDAALKDVARSYRAWLASRPADAHALQDLALTAALHRTHHPYRAGVVASTAAECAERLDRIVDESAARAPCFPGDEPKLVLVFSGQGSQWAGMGRELYEREPVFRELIERCDAILRRFASWSLIEVLLEAPPEDGRARLDRTEYAQPAILAVQAGLLALYRASGLRPDAVVGHSSGEMAAAYAAGVLTLEDVLRVAFHRGRLMQRTTGQGRMASVALTLAEARRAVEGCAGRVCVAAENGPESCVLSGEPEALAECLAALAERGVAAHDLGVDYAFHSARMEPVLAELVDALRGLLLAPARVPIVSTVTGALAVDGDFDAAYWARNVREPVRFAEAVRCVVGAERTVFLELGPRPVLRSPTLQSVEGREAVVLASLRQGQDERAAVLRSLAGLYEAGCELRWSDLCPEHGRRADLPTYPWQRRRYWIEPAAPVSLPASAVEASPEPASANGAAGNGAPAPLAVSDYYDRVTEFRRGEIGRFLTFVPFAERVPGFSWLLAFHEPEGREAYVDLVLEARREMRDVLFRGIDFASVRSVLDFGCGYGADLMTLAEEHEHLRLDGCTISPEQARTANREIRELGLADRVRVYNVDSSEYEFPGTYDLVFGFEVAHYIRDKHKLFANVDRHLSDGGFVVLADFIANTVSSIGHDETSSHIVTLDQWVELLSAYKLRVVECVDVSREMANFLHDPEAPQNLAYIANKVGDDGLIRGHYASYNGLGQLFERGLATYGLFTIRKDPYLTRQEIARVNRERLGALTPYAAALVREGGRTELRAASTGGVPDFTRWLYEVEWQPRALVEGDTPPASAGWLVFADEGGVGQALVGLLQARGEACVVVSRGDAYGRSRAGHYSLDPADPAAFRRLLADVAGDDAAGAAACRGALYLWGLDAAPAAKTTAETLDRDRAACCSGALHLAQALASVGAGAPRLWIATSGAQALGETPPTAFVQGASWGLGRTLAVECPNLWGGLIDLDPRAPARQAAERLHAELEARQDEDGVAWRGAERFVARLVARAGAKPRAEAPRLSADAAYLITGGLGGLGLCVARWMAEGGAREIVLLQRSALPDRARWDDVDLGHDVAERIAAVRAIEALGARVHAVAADVADGRQLGRAMAELRATLPPLRGVVHAAGVLDDGILEQLTAERFERVLAPKLLGAWNLHRQTLGEPLDFFVLFSSAAALLGSPGQANYAAANATLDAFAHYRRQLGLPATSVGWGPWTEVGMAAAQANRGQRVADLGIAGIAPERGVRILEHVLREERVQVAVVPIDLTQLARTWPRATELPLLRDLFGRGAAAPASAPPVSPPTPAGVSRPTPTPARVSPPTSPTAVPAPAPESATVLGRLVAASPAARPALLKDYLLEQAARVLQLVPSELDYRRPLNACGIDSLMAVELRNRIESDLKVNLEFVSLLQGASLAELARSVEEQLATVVPGADPERVADVMRRIERMSDEDVKALLAEKKRAR